MSYKQPLPNSYDSIEMALIPGGLFKMGPDNQESDEVSELYVKVDSFWMGVYEITWDQFEVFLKEEGGEIEELNRKRFDNKIDGISTPTPEYVDMSFGMGREGGYPVVNITNYTAVMFTKWLYAKTGVFYRLPTEAEWEYACRAGSNDAYYFGNDTTKLDQFAWYDKNSEDGYNRVGQKKPNKFGLYDMLGNVSEWTIEQYRKDYFEKIKTDSDNPMFLPTELYPRAARGGSWKESYDDVRCSTRTASNEDWKILDPQAPKSVWWLTSAPFVGFRVMRPKKAPAVNEMEKYWSKEMKDY